MILPENKHLALEKEEIYRLVADSSHNWEEWRDPQGKLIYISPSCEQITGYSAEEFFTIPDLIDRLIYPDDQPILQEHRRQINEDGSQVCEIDFRILTRDGGIRWISHNCRPIHNAEGVWLGQRSSNRENTRRKLKEHALQMLINVPLDLLLLLDLDGKIVVANELLAKFTRIPLEQLPGKLLWDLFPPHVARFRKSVFEEVLKTGQPIRVEDHTSIRGADHQVFDSTVYPVRDTQGVIYQVAIIAHDITNMKQNEADRRQMDALLRSVIRMAPVSLAAIDTDGSITLIEGQQISELGMGMQENLGKQVSQVLPDGSEIQEAFAKALLGIETARVIAFDDGSAFEAHFAPILDESAAVKGATGIATNITGYLRTQAELRRAQQQLEVILEGMGEGVLVVNAQRELVYANHAVVAMSGYASAADLLADRNYFTRFDIFDETGRLLTPQEYPAVRTLLGEKVPPTMLRYQNKNGSNHQWLLVSGSPVFDSKGQIEMAIFLTQDVQAIKTTQDALQQSRDELEQRVRERTAELAQINRELRRERDFNRSLIETAQVGLLVLDQQGSILQMNRYLEQLTGYTLQDTQGNNWLDVVAPPEHKQRMQVSLRRALRGPQAGPVIFPLLTKGGRLIQIEWYDQLLKDEQNHPVGLLAIGQDVTMRLEIEKQLRRNTDKAESLARIGARMNAHLELKAILQTICEETARALEYHSSVIMLYDPLTEFLRIDAYYGAQESEVEQFPPLPRLVLQEFVDSQGDVMVIPDIQNITILHGENNLRQINTRTALVAVLHRESELIGLLSVISRNTPKPPTGDEIELLKALANLAEIAINRAQMFEEIFESRKRLQALSRKLIEVRFEESRRIARELHDETGQMLTSLQLKFDVIQRSLPDFGVEHAGLRPDIMDVRATISQLLQQVRDLSLNLRPPLLDDMGLLPALISYFQRFKRNYDIEVHFSHNLTGERYHPSIENSAFRIIQESLTNIARHAQVKDATVRLWCDEHCLGLQVVDDGAGFDLQAALASGLSGGLSGIKERVSLYHGQLEIETQPGAGCRITAEFPLDHNAEIG